MQCDRFMLTGGRCDLPQGHDGPHEKQYAKYLAKWTDEETKAAADRQGSRFD